MYLKPEQIVLSCACVLHSPLIEIKMRSAEVERVDRHQLFKVNALCTVKGIIGCSIFVVIPVRFIVKALVAERYHVIRIDALYIFAHFLSPVIKYIVLTLSVGIASRLV